MISAILLAAGQSQRMGGDNKLIKKYNKKHLINHILDTLIKSKIKKIIVVWVFKLQRLKK
jgi:molybdenum cofactor cytidylyltransferase